MERDGKRKKSKQGPKRQTDGVRDLEVETENA